VYWTHQDAAEEVVILPRVVDNHKVDDDQEEEYLTPQDNAGDNAIYEYDEDYYVYYDDEEVEADDEWSPFVPNSSYSDNKVNSNVDQLTAPKVAESSPRPPPVAIINENTVGNYRGRNDHFYFDLRSDRRSLLKN
jgi:hypothetical protein